MDQTNQTQINLFVYGSLREPAIFKSVSGLSFTLNADLLDDTTLLAGPALLAGYRRVSPDNIYSYAVAEPSSRIEGFVIYDVPSRAMAEIDRYEGKRYERETVTVNTARGPIKAEAYLAKAESMRQYFGDRFHVNLIHELWLRKRIEDFLEKHTRPGEKTPDAEIERRAQRELLAVIERDLVITHYRADAVSDYYLEHELDRPRPSIRHLYSDPEAAPFIENYLALVVKQVLLNQLDEHIQSRYRFELEHMRSSERYFKRSVSLLIALRMINENSPSVALIVRQCLDTMSYRRYDLIDYVKYAVKAAESLCDARVVNANLNRVRTNFSPGLVPLGAELEFSNVGRLAVAHDPDKPRAFDPVYSGFRYFKDFCLDVLCWKLGGYVDDHTGETARTRIQGFLEMAPGRLNIEGELSRPATADPWLLNQLIREIVAFYDVRPHSLHLSFQLRKNQINKQQVLPLSFAKCLLALGGGPELADTGKFIVSRMARSEIIQQQGGEELVFARTAKRRWYVGDSDISNKTPLQTTACVQQYKFMRLAQRANYEPLIMCLKGLQLAYNPAEYLTAEQMAQSPQLQEDYARLKDWAIEPDELSPQTINLFLKTVRSGLMSERHNRPAHKLHYIDWALSAIDFQLNMFNNQISKLRSGS